MSGLFVFVTLRARNSFFSQGRWEGRRRFSAPARGRRSRRRAGQGVHTAGAELVARARGARRTRFCRGHTLRRVGARSALRGCLPAGRHARTHRAIANAVLPSFQLLHQAEGARHHDASHRGSATAEQFGCRSGLQGKKHRKRKEKKRRKKMDSPTARPPWWLGLARGSRCACSLLAWALPCSLVQAPVVVVVVVRPRRPWPP